VHEQFDIGQSLLCALPQNNFRLHTDNSPAVLIAGGIGITPIKPMAQALRTRNNLLQIHYAARSRRDMAFGDRLQREFGDNIRLYSSADSERINIGQLLSSAPADAIFYICGPERLIDAVSAAASELKIDANRIRYERFSAAAIIDSQPIKVELRRSGKQIEVSADQSILDAMLDAGIEAAYSCRTGSCKTCVVKLLEGEPDHRDAALSETEREQNQLFCPCISRAQGDRLVLDI
jgi:ferredoxin-NADP reductase